MIEWREASDHGFYADAGCVTIGRFFVDRTTSKPRLWRLRLSVTGLDHVRIIRIEKPTLRRPLHQIFITHEACRAVMGDLAVAARTFNLKPKGPYLVIPLSQDIWHTDFLGRPHDPVEAD